MKPVITKDLADQRFEAFDTVRRSDSYDVSWIFDAVNVEDARALRTFEDALTTWTVEHAKQSPGRSNTTTEVEI